MRVEVENIKKRVILGAEARTVNAEIISKQDVSNYKTIILQVTGTFVATIAAWFSNDGENWKAGHLTNESTIPAFPAAALSAAGIYNVPVQGVYFKLTVINYTSGTVEASAFLSQIPISPLNVLATLVTVYGAGNASTNGLNQSKLISAATTNSTVIKSSPGRIYELTVSNTGSSTVYVKLYNAASITVGTTVPVAVYAIPTASLQKILSPNLIGKYFANGICMAITGAYADTDTTAVTAGAVIVNYSYC